MKKTLLILTLIHFWSLCAQSQVPADSLLLYYSFTGNANDESGNGYHGIVYGATLATDRFGNPNSAYYFDGIDDYIDMPNIPDLKPDLPVSFSFWVKLENMDIYDNQFFSTSPETGNYAGCTINVNNDGTININYGDNTGTNASTSRRSKRSSDAIVVGQWYHIAAVFRGATDMDIYINGALVTGTYSGSGGALQYVNVAGAIGRANTTTHYNWGYIDDFAYYNRSLDSCDVVELYTGQSCYAEISELKQNQLLSINPNPASDYINVILNSGSTEKSNEVQIINSLGQVVETIVITPGNNSINTDNWGKSGIYLLKLLDDQHEVIYTYRIIKK